MMTEHEFCGLYARVVSRAKELLMVRNRGCGKNWPAGQKWEQLGESSKSVFMREARAELFLDEKAFMSVVRNWPYSDDGWETIEALFGKWSVPHGQKVTGK